MFTVKFYSNSGSRQKILEAESFTILRDKNGDSEITLHRKNSNDDVRYDIICEPSQQILNCDYWPEIFQKAIIENSAGKTTEIISPYPAPLNFPA
jgi:hypothetical protein